MMDGKKMVDEAVGRMIENVVYLKSVDTKDMSKGDLFTLLKYAVEYPLQQDEPDFNTTKLRNLGSLITQIIKDKTLITIHSMGGKFEGEE